MANTLTNLIPEVYSALDVVSREMVGFIPAVTIDATTSRAAKDQTVRSFVAPAATAGDITPGVTPPDDGDQTIGNVSLSISKARRVPIRWNGEQTLGVNNGGPGASAIRAAQIQQAIRTLVNEIEADLAGLHVYASRAAGTAGTTPFGTANDYTGASLTRKILADNGCPMSDLQLVIDFKREHWSANLKMAEYLRPMTLFAPQKFAGYLAGAQRWVQIGRPRCLNGEWEGFEGKRKPMSNIAAAQQQARSLIESGAVSYDDDTPL